MQPASTDVSADQPAPSFLHFIPPLNPEAGNVWDFPNNDDGRASFFLSHFGGVVRYVPSLNCWRVWDGRFWHDDDTARVHAYCQRLAVLEQLKADEMKQEKIGELAEDLKTRTRLPKQREFDDGCGSWAKRAAALGNERIISQLLEAASKHAPIIANMEKWDADENKVGVLNGIVDLKSLDFRPAKPEDYITKQMAVTYSAGAECPEWDKFISKVLPGELGDYARRIAGYSLSGSTDDQAFYFLHGSGKNGKSIFVETLTRIFGAYGRKAARELVEESRRGGECKHHIARLPGVRFLHGEETSIHGKLREDVIKSLVGGDPLTGEAKYGTPFDFTPVAKLWIMGNHKPRIQGDDNGIWRRVRLLPFEVVISEEEEIPKSELLARFDVERSGILNWMLQGIAQCPTRPIPAPRAVLEAVADYRQSEDELADFLSIHVESDKESKLLKTHLHERYREWAKSCGVVCCLKPGDLSRRLSSRGGWVMDLGKRHWLGVRLIERPAIQ